MFKYLASIFFISSCFCSTDPVKLQYPANKPVLIMAETKLSSTAESYKEKVSLIVNRDGDSEGQIPCTCILTGHYNDNKRVWKPKLIDLLINEPIPMMYDSGYAYDISLLDPIKLFDKCSAFYLNDYINFQVDFPHDCARLYNDKMFFIFLLEGQELFEGMQGEFSRDCTVFNGYDGPDRDDWYIIYTVEKITDDQIQVSMNLKSLHFSNTQWDVKATFNRNNAFIHKIHAHCKAKATLKGASWKYQCSYSSLGSSL